MTTDYSEMSDVEISLAVGKIISFDSISCVGSSGKAHIHNWDSGLCTGWKEFDPCNSWADAGPIIIENRITITPLVNSNAWQAFVPYKIGDFNETDVNPLRAAMIVFLMMMNEDKNVQANS